MSNRETPHRKIIRKQMWPLWLMLALSVAAFIAALTFTLHPEIRAINPLNDHPNMLVRYIGPILSTLTGLIVFGCVSGIVGRIQENRELLAEMDQFTDGATPGPHGAN